MIFIKLKHLIGKVFRKLLKIFQDVVRNIRRIFLKNKNFTIISDNCWGGFIYQRYNLKYRTPTIGLFFYPQDYIRFLENINYYLSIPLKVGTRKDSKYKDINPERDYPIGVLDDVEIQLLHYKSCEEAISKWEKRKKRIDFNNCLIKMSNRSSLFTADIYQRFENLKFKNKILFTKDNVKYKDCIYVEKFKDIVDTNVSEIPFTLKKIKLRKILNDLSK